MLYAQRAGLIFMGVPVLPCIVSYLVGVLIGRTYVVRQSTASCRPPQPGKVDVLPVDPWRSASPTAVSIMFCFLFSPVSTQHLHDWITLNRPFGSPGHTGRTLWGVTEEAFKTAVPFWGKNTEILLISILSPRRDCSPKRAITGDHS